MAALISKMDGFKIFMILLLMSMSADYYFYDILKQTSVTDTKYNKYTSESQYVSFIKSSQSQIQNIDQRGTWPIMTINLMTEFSLTDALMMSLTCTVTVGKNISDLYDIRWNGTALKHLLWIQQSNVSKYGDNIEKKLVFEPWLNSFAGEYTCHLFKKNNLHSVLYNKSYVISGSHRGLISSRNFSRKFENVIPSKWFLNANLCGGDYIWHKYAEFHKSVLSGKEKQKYLIYNCTQSCGGYGNRISGITVLLLYAMHTNRAFLLRMTKPVDINSYLLPNAIKWNHTGTTGLTTKHVNLLNEENFNQYLETFETAVLGNQYDIVNVKINFGLFYYITKMNEDLLRKMITMLSLKTHYDLVLLYGCAFNYLFKYQQNTIKTIDALQHELGLETGKFVGLHIRSRIGDGYNLFHLKYERMFECAAMAAKSLSQKLNIKVPIFLAADHPSVMQYATQYYNDSIVLSRAPIFHIDKTKYKGDNATSQYDNGMMGMLSDVEICSRSHTLIRSVSSTLSEVMGAIHFLSPKRHLHPFYYYDNLSVCQL